MLDALDLSFKGSRDYLQGADIIDAVGRSLARLYDLQRVRQIAFTMNRLARRAVQFELDGRPLDEKVVGHVRFAVDGHVQVGSLVEIDRPVTGRRAYPEDQIVERCRFDLVHHRCDLAAPLQFTTLEHVIAMNKALHHRCFPDASGRWLFVKLEFVAFPPRSCEGQVVVRLVQHFGEKLTKSEVRDERDRLGYVYFSLVRSR